MSWYDTYHTSHGNEHPRYKIGGVEKAPKSGEHPFEALQASAFKTQQLKDQAQGLDQCFRCHQISEVWNGFEWSKGLVDHWPIYGRTWFYQVCRFRFHWLLGYTPNAVLTSHEHSSKFIETCARVCLMDDQVSLPSRPKASRWVRFLPPKSGGWKIGKHIPQQ